MFDDDELGDAYARAASVTRRRAKNFYYGLCLTPRPRRDAVYAIYAWMRAGDDAADDAPTAAERCAALDRLRVLTGWALFGRTGECIGEPAPLGGEWWPAFAHAVERYRVPHEIIAATLDGLDEDAGHAGYETLEDLEGYCRRVASTAGRACVYVWGLAGPEGGVEADALASELGVAFQLTNILRDVREDAELGRCYVPRAVLRRYGVTADSLLAWQDERACRGVVMQLAARATTCFGAAARLETLIAPDCRATLWAMTEIYRRVLEAIVRDPRLCVAPSRAGVPVWRKVGIAATALGRQWVYS